MSACLTRIIGSATIPQPDAREVVAIPAQPPANCCRSAFLRARNTEIVRLPSGTALYGLSELLYVGNCRNAGDRGRAIAAPRTVYPSGFIHSLRGDGGGLLPGSSAPQLFSNPQSRRNHRDVVLRLSLSLCRRRWAAEPG